MVRLRLRRVGGNKQPSFRLVATDIEMPRDGRFLEVLGHYNPRTEPATIHLEEDRIFDWISRGAKPSESVMKLFKVTGTLDRFARLKAGEDVQVLMAEAKAAEEKRTPSPKTSH
jgi:small subunit ribosomal protein S16